jgi:hypothetical protein
MLIILEVNRPVGELRCDSLSHDPEQRGSKLCPLPVYGHSKPHTKMSWPLSSVLAVFEPGICDGFSISPLEHTLLSTCQTTFVIFALVKWCKRK